MWKKLLLVKGVWFSARLIEGMEPNESSVEMKKLSATKFPQTLNKRSSSSSHMFHVLFRFIEKLWRIRK